MEDFLFEVMSEKNKKIIMEERYKEIEKYGQEKESAQLKREAIKFSPEEYEPDYGSE